MSEGTWYRTGLVSLANGSDLVAGAGTEFIANVLPGAIFFAPEGLYEVERAVSDTQLKLVEPYAGPTVAGAEFAIAPTQGAVVQATKQLQAFLSELGELKQAWESGDLDPKGLATKGVKNTVEELPAVGNAPGDAWLVDGVLYMWTGAAWSNQGSSVTTPELEGLRDETIAAKDAAAAIAGEFGDVAGAVDAATTQAGVALGGATTSVAASVVAELAKTAAELVRDATLAAGRLRPTQAVAQADGSIAVGDGYVAPLSDGSLQAYRKDSSSASTALGSPFPSNARVAKLEGAIKPQAPVVAKAEVVVAFADANGYSPLTIDSEGEVVADKLTSKRVAASEVQLSSARMMSGVSEQFLIAFADAAGNVAFGIRLDGSVYPDSAPAASAVPWTELTIGSDDSIAHVGNSYTQGLYVLKDKAFISQLSELSPYRHQNFGVSGDDALDMQYRIVNNTIYGGALSFAAMKARYAFITTLTNDTYFRAVKQGYYAENIRRLIETVRAVGTEPILTSEFVATPIEHALLRRVADEMGCQFVDCTSIDAELGGLQQGPFHQGHPGTRTGGVFWLPMLDFIDRMPAPTRAIKIYRRRSTFAVAAIADLLYKDRVDRSHRWKEITVSHSSITPESKFEELNQLGASGTDFNFVAQADEYQRIAAGAAVAFTDYALLELTLPSTAMALDAVELTLTTTGAPIVYARDFLNVAASMPGRVQGSTPTDATYLSKWNTPRGAWRSLGAYAAPIVIPAADLRRSMQGDKLVLLLAGDFSLTGLKVRYRGREVKGAIPQRLRAAAVGVELLAQPLCGTAPQLAGWTLSGAPAALVPIDLANAPRKPGLTTPVDGVCTVTATDMIKQAFPVSAETGTARRFRLTVWARYFPKAFLTPSLYPGLDAGQVIDRVANPSAAPITTNTCDLRTLKCEVWLGSGVAPSAGGAEYFDFAALQYRPIEFAIEVPPYEAITNLSFRLSCPDGAIQIAKVSAKEIQ